MNPNTTAETIFRRSSHHLDVKTDQLLARLLLVEWILSVLFAIVFSPKSWAGDYGQIHIHLYAALFVGGPAAIFPALLVLNSPGERFNRYVITLSQMVFSTLLIHSTAGRVETHFHIFGSLAFLAFYRDWKVLALATTITAADHFIEGIYWPAEIYGVASASYERAIEYTGWVLFEDIFLFVSVQNSLYQLRKNAEQLFEVQQSVAEANRANSMKSTFLANISHELRTPMHGILGFAEIGLETHNDLKPEEVQSYFSEIQDSGKRLLALLNDLLDLSKLEAGKMSYEMKDNDIYALIDTVNSELIHIARAKGLEIEVCGHDHEFIGYFDETRIQQVVRNLISNAIKFSTANTKIVIRAEDVGATMIVSVTNYGVGIPPEELKAVFDKFVQSTKTRSKAGGTGLGLAICKEIITAHRGNIWVESEVGKTTRFSIELPVNSLEKTESLAA